MFKLVVVGGRLRGKEFILNDGENVIGREADNDVSVFIFFTITFSFMS